MTPPIPPPLPPTIPPPPPSAPPQDSGDPLDRALSLRLRQLGGMPVDTTRLEARLKKQLPTLAGEDKNLREWFAARLLKPLLATAAGLLLVVGMTWAALQGGEVRADPGQIVRLHEDMVAGRVEVMRVDTIAQANDFLANRWSASGGGPKLPQPPEGHLHACCMKPLQNRQVASVLLEYQGTAVTMTVAKATDFSPPKGAASSQQEGLACHTKKVGAYNMVMMEHNQVWVCLVSSLPEQDLKQLLTQLRF